MNHKSIAIIALAFGLAVPVTALAETLTSITNSSVETPSLIQRLQEQERMNEVKAKFWSQEPLIQRDYYVQAKQCRRVIAKISAGESVSNAELAQALRPVETAY